MRNLKAAGNRRIRPEAAQFPRRTLGTGTRPPPHPTKSLTLYIPVPRLPLPPPGGKHAGAKSDKT